MPKLCGAHVIALWSWELTRLDAHRKTCARPRRCGGGNHAFTLKDDADHKISGYTTFDLMGSQETGFGTFSAGKEYSTVWGQRAALFYSPPYGPEYLYDYQGRGRTYSLTWWMAY